jgi:predicted 3-demethylubiquinone-9 3-methyltransferase (glyoxalase superfamily)
MHKLSTSLWFDNQAEEAAKFYTSIFKDGRIIRTARYNKEGHEKHGGKAGTVMTVEFEMAGQSFVAINGGPIFKFNESISIVINCDSQEEIDYYWKALTAGGKEVECGWLQDKYGLSWQVTPRDLGRMVADPDPAKAERVTKAFMAMKKFNIDALKRAYEGR